jgi:hypothetical protein
VGWLGAFPRQNVLIRLYDEIETDPQAYLDRICDFIGISRIAIMGSPIATDQVNSYGQAPKNRRLGKRARKLAEWLTAHEFYNVTQLVSRAGLWRFCFERGEEFRGLDPATEARVRERFPPEIEQIEQLIGRDLSAWKRPHPRHCQSKSERPAPSAGAAASGE